MAAVDGVVAGGGERGVLLVVERIMQSQQSLGEGGGSMYG